MRRWIGAHADDVRGAGLEHFAEISKRLKFRILFAQLRTDVRAKICQSSGLIVLGSSNGIQAELSTCAAANEADSQFSHRLRISTDMGVGSSGCGRK